MAFKKEVAQFLNDHRILLPILQLLLLINQIYLETVDFALDCFAPIHLLRLLCREAIVLLPPRFAVGCTILVLALASAP